MKEILIIIKDGMLMSLIAGISYLGNIVFIGLSEEMKAKFRDEMKRYFTKKI